MYTRPCKHKYAWKYNYNQFSEHFRQKLSPENTRNGISEHQEFKICRGAGPHKLLSACAFSTCEIHQWSKNIPIFHTQKVGQSSGLVRLLVNLSEENRSYWLVVFIASVLFFNNIKTNHLFISEIFIGAQPDPGEVVHRLHAGLLFL